ncbi:fungal-specific transcription factor domain-containing protein [Vararia minispora EC-137]|uniref:Fungal-specific transcription factor domain-containing protein n=1 Tax=Vararia minispora EC-137 TaxID=1314806 RepID=A0ACB8QVW6_9AGAM|nr:fungal-specific transcription factor domain-containing protein [Vararia minispora EC-137]
MSSAEDESPFGRSRKARDPKKRRVARACDICRRRKGDGEQGPGRKCANCAVANLECSYVQAMKKYPEGYVEALEHKLEKFEALIKRLHPTEDFTREIGIPLTRDNWMLEGVLGDPEAVTIPGAYRGGTASTEPSSDELDELDDKLEILAKDMTRLHVGAFRGKSSGAAIVQATLEIRQEVSGIGNRFPTFMQIKRPEYWEIREVGLSSPLGNMFPSDSQVVFDRPASTYKFPEPDLLWTLVEAYFVHINCIQPILHKPTFVKHIRDNLHLHDEAFGGVLLMVCAVGSRVADDRRVLSGNGHGDGSWHSAGWTWFTQVNLTQKTLLSNSRLYDLQLYCLATIYLLGTSLTHTGWNLCGIGIRLAQDIGAHRKNVYNDKPTVEDELYKRAFWMTRSSFDLGLPCDCDDEYWEPSDPELAFQQPAGKPSRVAYFIQSIKLIRILGSTLNWFSMELVGHGHELVFLELAGSKGSYPTLIRSCETGRKLYQTIIPVMVAGVMLLLGVWHIKRSGLSVNQEKENEDTESRWQSAGRLWDVLSSLASVAIEQPPQTISKRSRVQTGDTDTDDYLSLAGSATAYASSSTTAYNSSPSSAPSSSPPVPLAPISSDPDPYAHAIHSAAAAAYAPSTNLVYEAMPPPPLILADGLPTNESIWSMSDHAFANTFTTDVMGAQHTTNLYAAAGPSTATDASTSGYYRHAAPTSGTPILAYDPYDDISAQEASVGRRDVFGTDFNQGIQATHPSYRGVPAPARIPPVNPPSHPPATDWRERTMTSGSLADAVPPEHSPSFASLKWYARTHGLISEGLEVDKQSRTSAGDPES